MYVIITDIHVSSSYYKIKDKVVGSILFSPQIIPYEDGWFWITSQNIIYSKMECNRLSLYKAKYEEIKIEDYAEYFI